METIPDVLVFLVLWDEDYGPQKIAAHPPSSLDIDNLGAFIFTTFQYFWDSPEKAFEKANFTLPLETHARKMRVLIQTIPNPKVRGGLQPYAVAVVLPDHLPDAQLPGFDPILIEISANYARTKEVSLPSFEKRLQNFFQQIQEIPVPPVPPTTYPFSAAVEDFQAGVRTYKEGTVASALPLILKSLGRFEADANTKLVMEATYLLASFFTQLKQYNAARSYFRRLKPLAQTLSHNAYRDVAMYMEAFCAYKLEDYYGAVPLLSGVHLEANKSVNPLQYRAIYGFTLSKLGRTSEALEQLREALELSQTTGKDTPAVTQQRTQILFEMAKINYNEGIWQAERTGFQKLETYQQFLTQSLAFCDEALKLWDSLKDFSSLFTGYQVAASLLSALSRPQESIQMYENALELFEDHKLKANLLPLFDKLVQLRTRLGLHQENAKAIRKFLARASSYTFLDILSLASYQEMAGDAFANGGALAEASKEYLHALDTYQQLKQPPLEMVSLLNKMIRHFEGLSDLSRVAILRSQLRELQTAARNPAPAGIVAPSLGNVKEFWIFHTETGLLLYGMVKETRVDADLLGGFLTALQEFSLNLSRQRLDTMVIGRDQFVFHYETGRECYILSRAPARLPNAQVKSVLLKIYNRFWREYSKFLTKFSGDTSPFENFGKILATLDFSSTE